LSGRLRTHQGCDYQVGTDMLFEHIQACRIFGLGATTSDELREVAQIHDMS
jgi:hypothetical protein